MKNLFILLASVALVSCAQTDYSARPNGEPNPDNGNLITVRFDPGGEISSSIDPISRNDNDYIFALQAYCRIPGETEYTRYAYGSFDNFRDMNIDLYTDREYKFDCVLVQGMIGKFKEGFFQVVEEDGGNPVFMNTATNQFYYTSDRYLTNMDKTFYEGNDGNPYKYGNFISYKAVTENFKPLQSEVITLILKKTYFVGKFVAENLPDGMTLKISTQDAPPLYLDSSDEEQAVEQEFTFHDKENAWMYNEYSVNLPVVFSFVMQNGEEDVIGTSMEIFMRNMRTTVRIKFTDADDPAKEFYVVFEDGEVDDLDESTVNLGIG